MDATRVHQVLNYIPLVGTVLGLIVLLFGTWRKRGLFTMIGLGLLCFTGVIVLIVFATGEVAGKGAELMKGPPWTNIVVHKDSAMSTFAAVLLNGIFAAFGFWSLRRRSRLARWNLIALVLISLAATALAERTTYLGRHIFDGIGVVNTETH